MVFLLDVSPFGEGITTARTLLTTLDSLQRESGCVDEAIVPLIAAALNFSEEEVRAAIRFLRDFDGAQPGRHLLKICRAESCRSMGCENLVRHIEGRLGIGLNQTTPDRALTFEHIFCLGRCRDSPAMMLDGVLLAKVTPQLADFLIECAQWPPSTRPAIKAAGWPVE